MKMYADLTVEGTPEEVAAFKHIDAALGARNNRRSTLAIEAPKKTATPKKKTPRAPKLSQKQIEEVVAQATVNDGLTADEMARRFGTNRKTAYNRLYRLRSQGLLWLTDDGVFKASR